MVIGLLMMGFIVVFLSFFIDVIGTSNALLISTVLFVLAIVLLIIKSKKVTK
ncbi:hypothetical protein [Piscibacillus halophilus]|uniref:Uncharacterized protein n=1 Tax=Piscibacillus halophilus TaxID=571933 RepID=A0A1H9IJP1_9BACI|nr:hypothetical protein [Piscibacillus halophilus]SEQ74702.1 hypothetical protein SAMN05216362_12521 [Piscibacillus halophilus]